MPRRRYGILGFFYRKLRRSSAYSASSFSEPSTLWWSNSLSHINPEEERKRSIEVASDSKDKIEKKRQKRSKSSEHLEELGSTQMLDKMVGYKETKFIECLIDEGFSVEELLVLKDKHDPVIFGNPFLGEDEQPGQARYHSPCNR